MATPAQDRKLRDPVLNPGDQPYFDACAEGKLLIKKCGDLLKQPISLRQPIGFVEYFEIVEIKHGDRKQHPIPPVHRQIVVERFVQRLPIA